MNKDTGRWHVHVRARRSAWIETSMIEVINAALDTFALAGARGLKRVVRLRVLSNNRSRSQERVD